MVGGAGKHPAYRVSFRRGCPRGVRRRWLLPKAGVAEPSCRLYRAVDARARIGRAGQRELRYPYSSAGDAYWSLPDRGFERAWGFSKCRPIYPGPHHQSQCSSHRRRRIVSTHQGDLELRDASVARDLGGGNRCERSGQDRPSEIQRHLRRNLPLPARQTGALRVQRFIRRVELQHRQIRRRSVGIRSALRGRPIPPDWAPPWVRTLAAPA